MKKVQENKNEIAKKVYATPSVEKINIDHEISLVMMSNPPGEFPTQDPLMSIKAFKIF